MFCKYIDFKNFPFDIPEFKFKFEIANFTLDIDGKEETFRFNFYRRWIKEMHWNPKVDNLPNYEIDYKSLKINTLVEHKMISG